MLAPIVKITVNQTEISGNGSAAASPDDGDGIFLAAGTSQFGYMNASITNNHFSGNANIDFVTQSFTTTAVPAATNLFANTAGNPAINAAFQPDPVARLALTLTGNVGNTIDVTRVGASYSNTDAFKTTNGVYDDPFIDSGIYQFTSGPPADDTRVRNAQREPGVFNQGGTPIDGGALVIGGIWGTYAHDASATTPDTAAGTSTTTSVVSSNGIILNSGDYSSQNTVVQILGGPDAGEIRTISGSSSTTQTLTIGPALTTSPAGSQFTVTAYEQAGVGQSTFVTDSGPSVTSHNTWGTVISDFSTELVYGGNVMHPSGAVGDFSYTWQTFPPGSFGTPFP